jgi:hypothetical protein
MFCAMRLVSIKRCAMVSLPTPWSRRAGRNSIFGEVERERSKEKRTAGCVLADSIDPRKALNRAIINEDNTDRAKVHGTALLSACNLTHLFGDDA